MFSKALTLAAFLGASNASISAQQRIESTEVMQGLLNSYGGDFNLMALLACIGEEDKALLVLDAGIQSLEAFIQSKNFGDLLGAGIAFFAAYQQAMQGLPACEAIDQAGAIKAFQADAQAAASQINLLTAEGDASIMQLVVKLIKDYEAKDMKAVGMDLFELLQKILKKKESAPAMSRKDITEFAQGYLEATNVGHINFTYLLECIYVADEAAEVADMLYMQVEQALHDKQIEEIIPVVILSIALVQGVKQALPVCEAVDQDTLNWTTYNKIIDTVESPLKFIKVVDNQIVAGGETITKDIGETLAAFRSGDFYTAGLDLGATMKNTCEP